VDGGERGHQCAHVVLHLVHFHIQYKILH
jgi:hypothetical protein